MVLGIPGYKSEGGGRCGVRNTRNTRQREEEKVVLGIPGHTSKRGGRSGVRNNRIHV